MKVKHIIALFLALNILGCETVDFGDTNANNNGPSSPYPAGMLAGAIMTYATQTGRFGLTQPTLYVQYQSQVTYTDEMRYNEVPIDWTAYYRDILVDLRGVIDFNSDPKNANDPALLSQGAPQNQIGVAMIMRAIVMKRVTDTWGDVPFSQALQGADNLTPVYDTQETIYGQLISDLKEGRNMLDNTMAGPTGDIIYNGDVEMWKKLANSVILQTALTQSKRFSAPGDVAATEFQAALNDAAGVIDEVDEEAWVQFEDLPGFRNPWNANRAPDYFLSKEFTDALTGNVVGTSLNPTSNHTYDERIEVIATDATKPGVPYGFANGTGGGASQVSLDYYWNNITPLPLMTASYTFLNRAEAANLGWTGEDVATMLQDGIEASYESFEFLTETAAALNNDPTLALDLDPTAYVAARLADADTEGYEQVIAEEKWVALFGMAFDAWSEWRRTGFPVLTPATDYLNNGQIPRRYLYPSEESALNTSNYNTGVSKLMPAEDRNTSRVWWDQ